MNKYRAKKTFYKNVIYDSKKEAKRAYELDMLSKAGEISHLERQKTFVLQDGFINNQGKKIRQITYIADFVYYDEKNKHWVAEDTKGFRTDVYRIKRKLFECKYTDFFFKES